MKNHNPAKHVALDGITGKITKAWQFVGKKADVVNIVPYGDLTYPCISLCDLICGYIRNTVHHIDAMEILIQLKVKRLRMSIRSSLGMMIPNILILNIPIP